MHYHIHGLTQNLEEKTIPWCIKVWNILFKTKKVRFYWVPEYSNNSSNEIAKKITKEPIRWYGISYLIQTQNTYNKPKFS